jgi:thymidylate synthase ThyX
MKVAAKIIADTMGLAGARITTFEVVAPRFLLAEVNTHRAIARSAASSRAIPVMKRIEMVKASPFVPSAFGKNKPGMQADEELSEREARMAAVIWGDSAARMIEAATSLAELGVHKQQVNRILEPWSYYAGVMTATEWDWFFKLRNHPEAQPEFQELAGMMEALYRANEPKVTEINGRRLHLPYVTTDDLAALSGRFMIAPSEMVGAAFAVSAARCARVSYKTHDGRPTTLEEDHELTLRLVKSGHLSPFDHPAEADVLVSGIKPNYVWDGQDGLARYWKRPRDHRHFWGWIPRRVEVEVELGVRPSRDSFAPIPQELLEVKP